MAAALCAALAMFAYMLLQFCMGLFLGATIPARFGGFMLTAAMSVLTVPVIYPVALSIETIGGETWKE